MIVDLGPCFNAFAMELGMLTFVQSNLFTAGNGFSANDTNGVCCVRDVCCTLFFEFSRRKETAISGIQNFQRRHFGPERRRKIFVERFFEKPHRYPARISPQDMATLQLSPSPFRSVQGVKQPKEQGFFFVLKCH